MSDNKKNDEDKLLTDALIRARTISVKQNVKKMEKNQEDIKAWSGLLSCFLKADEK
jgi:hypothetical protein